MTPTEKRALRAAAKRGAKWMDEHYPEWATPGIISLTTLDQADGTTIRGDKCGCVITQYFRKPYRQAILEILGSDVVIDLEWEANHGFWAFLQEDSYPVLTECWRAEILARRAAS